MIRVRGVGVNGVAPSATPAQDEVYATSRPGTAPDNEAGRAGRASTAAPDPARRRILVTDAA